MSSDLGTCLAGVLAARRRRRRPVPHTDSGKLANEQKEKKTKKKKWKLKKRNTADRLKSPISGIAIGCVDDLVRLIALIIALKTQPEYILQTHLCRVNMRACRARGKSGEKGPLGNITVLRPPPTTIWPSVWFAFVEAWNLQRKRPES